MIDAIVTLALFALVFGLSRLSAKSPSKKRVEPIAARKPASPPPGSRPAEPLHEGDSLYTVGRYAGSLGGIAGEGDDPCHDGMGATAAWGGDAAPVQTTLAPGVRLSFEANDVIKGILYAEILNRKPARRIR